MKVLHITAYRFLNEEGHASFNDDDFIEFTTPEQVFIYLRDNPYILLLVGHENYTNVILKADNSKELSEIAIRFQSDPDLLSGAVQRRVIHP